MPQNDPVIIWFRNDLRLADNPAVDWAARQGCPVICLFILEEDNSGARAPGGASRWWLDKSLRALSEAITARGGSLTLRRGCADGVISDLVRESRATGVAWNRRYEQGACARDADIKGDLRAQGLNVNSFNASLLNEPWSFTTGSGGHYKVFTPYWKAVWSNYRVPDVLDAPASLAGPKLPGDAIEDWGLHPSEPDWSVGFETFWTPGEAGAARRLEQFLDGPVNSYGEDRNRPDMTGTSGLSPHLRWGEIGPAQIWRAVTAAMETGKVDDGNARIFLSELVWREFSYVLLYHHPDLSHENYNRDFRHMPWQENPGPLRAWQRGQTGYPIVDAGMRQLWQTGWMHNRVRMIVASFLTKHLMVPWQRGEDWFWDTLVDADPAANAASWQWVAGSGADAAPYFRVFNPITQGEKFDKSGDYVRKWCPELAKLPGKYLHSPWTAPPATLSAAGIRLGETYPRPLIDHMTARKRALEAYETFKERRETA